MRIAGLGLALVACAQLTLLSSPALADDSSASASASPASSSATTSSASASSPAPVDHAKKEKTGWIVLGVGGAVAVGGIVLDIVATQVGNNVPGQTGTTTTTAKTNLYWGGSTMIVAGLLAGVYGGSMILDARKAAEPAPSQPPSNTGHTDDTARAAQAALARAPSFVLPLVGARF
jgi:hypothetical protein